MNQKNGEKINFIGAIKIIIENWNRASVMQGAAEMAYYLLLSLIPLLLVVANIIPLLPIETSEVMNIITDAFPQDVAQIIMPIVSQYLESGSGGAISIGLIASIWSASNVLSTLRRVLDEVYGAAQQKNFIIARILSLLIMFAILLAVAAAVFIFVFGEQILNFVGDMLQVEIPFLQTFLIARWVGLPVILFIVGMIIYDLVPNHHLNWRYAVPGAAFMTLGLILLSQFFSFVVQFMGGTAATNQTIGGFIVLMLFLYISSVIILLGALTNTLTFELVNGESVHDYESRLSRKEQYEESDYQGYPDIENTAILKRKLYKVN
jgi:membrane protein